MEALFHKKKTTLFANLGMLLALAAIALTVSAGAGARMDWWHFGTGFMLLRWGVYVAIAAAVLLVLGVFAARPGREKKGFAMALLGLVITAPIIIVPLLWLQTARSVPPIHDISTDTQNPPVFDAIAPLRDDAPNPMEYGGPAVAKQQKLAYPDIESLLLDIPPDAVYEAALAIAQQSGWNIVAKDPDNKRIEATDTTFWFGFKDDVVIRIVPANGGSKVDMRSLSRVGKSDVGTNAQRIRSFLETLKTASAQGERG